MRSAMMFVLLSSAAFAQDPTRDETGILPEGWSIEEEIKGLQTSVGDFNHLITSLGTASTQLQELLTKHLKNPKDKVVQSSLEKSLASYAENASKDFDRVIAYQDATLSNFRALNRKLNRFNSYLKVKIQMMRTTSTESKKKVEKMEKELEELAVTIKHASNKDEEQAARRKFAKLHHEYRLQVRYAQGYEKAAIAYGNLSEHLGTLDGHFLTLRDKFGILIDNLASEKKFLVDNMTLQEDNMKVRVLIQDGILSGNDAIGSVTEKMAVLFLKVDAFNKINDRITGTLDSFMDFQQTLIGIGEKLQKIGTDGTQKTMEGAIDDFYNRRFGGGSTEQKPVETPVEKTPATDGKTNGNGKEGGNEKPQK